MKNKENLKVNKTKKLLSIGEISKISLISVRALRYYDEKNIFKPIHVDPQTGYRYYEISQIPELSYIKISSELDIPLEKIKCFRNVDSEYNFSQLLAHAEDIARKKKEKIEKQLLFINRLQEKFEAKKMDQNIVNKITNQFEDKQYYCLPYANTISESDYQIKIGKLATQAIHDGFELFSDWGKVHVFSKKGIKKYVYFEVYPTRKTSQNIITIPKGKYSSSYYQESMIDKISERENISINQDKGYFIESELISYSNDDKLQYQLSISL